MTRYLSSIIATVFFVVAIAAFGFQLAVFEFAPIAQYVVLSFMLVFTVLIWVADAQASRQMVGRDLYHRIIAENGLFPIVGYLVQCVFALLYGLAWNTVLNPVATGLRLVLPKGLFLPLIVELVITAVVVVFWLGNVRANDHTALQHVEHEAKISSKEQLKGQVLLLKQRVGSADSSKAETMRFIEQKVSALPLNPSASALPLYQQAIQLIIAANQTPGEVTLETLENIKRAVAMVR
ncbi:hypothetical protein EMO92_10210 [Bifidobacterium reuteri]|uniref:Uncharacterized protein n=1 Tax=Bifidobacterium reuteri TaxID=983706 RepID=A0A5J5E2P0_9BIFI|nr:hypothetical protein [Bifidobacterium reuteri]KAA8823325.1 hypothetical protein EMO92_10210 [Bifidobacterium reuteri]